MSGLARSGTTARTPFLGGFGVGRSRNAEDSQLTNLFLELIDTKAGKQPGYFQMAPGLTLVASVGNGPIRGMETLNGLLYIVSGNQVYTLNAQLVSALQGTIATSAGPVSIINNGTQIAIFDGINGYLAPAGRGLLSATLLSGGSLNAVGDVLTLLNVGGTQIGTVSVTVTAVAYEFSSGVLGGTMTGYVNGDTVTLANVGGVQTEPVTITVTSTSGGVVDTYTVTSPGQFASEPTSFTQASTSGAGTGLTFTSPAFLAGVVTGYVISSPGSFSAAPSGFTQASTTGSGSGFALTLPQLSSTSNLTTIDLPFSGPVSATYQDGYGLVNAQGTAQWYQSNINDLSIWQPLNFSTANSQPDDVQAMISVYDQVYLLKQTNTEVWVNAGLPGFAFQKVAGVLIERGIAAVFSLALADKSLMFLGQNSQGQGVVIELTGYEDKRVSTHAIEYQIAKWPMLTDAIGYCYQQEGHLFYVLTSPSGDQTLVYDVTASRMAGVPIWHQRAAFLNGQFHRHWGNAFALWQLAVP
jgi:hypothetical protein